MIECECKALGKLIRDTGKTLSTVLHKLLTKERWTQVHNGGEKKKKNWDGILHTGDGEVWWRWVVIEGELTGSNEGRMVFLLKSFRVCSSGRRQLTDTCKCLYSNETHLAKLGGPQKATPLLSSMQRRLADPRQREEQRKNVHITNSESLRTHNDCESGKPWSIVNEPVIVSTMHMKGKWRKNFVQKNEF